MSASSSETHPTSSLGEVRLRIRGAQGQVEVVTVKARSEAEAVRRMVARGAQVLAIESAGLGDHSGARPSAVQAPRLGGHEASAFPLLLFSQELLALLDAGLNLTEALATLSAKARQRGVKQVIDHILQLLNQGKCFSDALSALAPHFPAIYVAAVRASEQTGDLPQTLARYIAYQVQLEGIRKKMVSAAIYPAMLLIVGGFVTLFLLGYVVPRFSAVYDSAGRDMPWLSLQLLRMGKLIYNHAALTGGIVVAGLAGAVWTVSRPPSRRWLLAQVMKLPWLAEQMAAFRLARFYRAVGMLMASGIALPRALPMVADLLSAEQQAGLSQARQAIEHGHKLSDALLAAGLTTPVAESLIKVGERTGQMADMLERVARFQDEDFARWIDWASKLLEPILMTVMGLVIGAVVVLMYMPIFDLAGGLQ